MKKTYDWSTNKFETIYTLRVYEGSKMVAKLTKIDGQLLQEAIKELKANGYTYKWETK